MSKERLLINGESIEVDVLSVARHGVRFVLDGRTYEVEFENSLTESASNKPARKRTGTTGATQRKIIERDGKVIIVAPMPGVIIEIPQTIGSTVTENDIVLRIEAMKMQNNIFSPRPGRVAEIFVTAGQEVMDGEELVSIEIA